jgi:hypothetical protein
MDTQQQTINEQYDEVDRQYTEALYATHESRRSAETRLALLTKLQDGHGKATSAAAQLEVIKSVMEELAG